METRKLSKILCDLKVFKINQALPLRPSCVPAKAGIYQKGIRKKLYSHKK